MSNVKFLPRPCLVCERQFTPDHSNLTKLCSSECRAFRMNYYFNTERPKNIREAILWEQIGEVLRFGFVTAEYKGAETMRNLVSITLTKKGKEVLGRR